MFLLSPVEREAVTQRLTALHAPVRLLFFSQTVGEPESAALARQIVHELAGLSDWLSVEEVNFILEKPRAEALGIDRVPAMALFRGDVDARIRFLGAPSGYEFNSLIEGIVIAGSDGSGLSDSTVAQLAGRNTPLDIKVFVTPSCPHCPRAVTLANRIAAATPLATSTCIEATEFIDLSRRFRVTGVPKTVVNGSIEILGVLPEDEFILAVLGVSGGDSSLA